MEDKKREKYPRSSFLDAAEHLPLWQKKEKKISPWFPWLRDKDRQKYEGILMNKDIAFYKPCDSLFIAEGSLHENRIKVGLSWNRNVCHLVWKQTKVSAVEKITHWNWCTESVVLTEFFFIFFFCLFTSRSKSHDKIKWNTVIVNSLFKHQWK